MFSVIVHMLNEDPVVCELEEMPEATARFLTLHSPRRRDGKDLFYLDDDVTSMIVPWHRINFIQIMPSVETEEVVGFVRE